MHLRAGGRVLELDDPTSSSMAPIFSDTWLGTELWPAARALVALLEERRPLLAAATQVLELGAGTGACGLAAAALGARRVLLTDKPLLLPVMRANVAANVFDGCVVECAELTWRSAGDESRSPGDESEEQGSEGTLLQDRLPAGADLVLASDCLNPVYGLGHAAALAATIHDALSLSAAARHGSALHSSSGAGSTPLAAAAADDGSISTAVPEALLAQTRRGDMCAVTLSLALTPTLTRCAEANFRQLQAYVHKLQPYALRCAEV